jgi:hypothetical protein
VRFRAPLQWSDALGKDDLRDSQIILQVGFLVLKASLIKTKPFITLSGIK